jgi:hypothetical protein
MVPSETQQGDSVVFLQGSEVPMVLRPVQDRFNFIGESYVHGLMDGCFWDARNDSDTVMSAFKVV